MQNNEFAFDLEELALIVWNVYLSETECCSKIDYVLYGTRYVFFAVINLFVPSFKIVTENKMEDGFAFHLESSTGTFQSFSDRF